MFKLQAKAKLNHIEVIAYFLGATELNTYWRVYAKRGKHSLAQNEAYICPADFTARQVARKFVREVNKEISHVSN